eukprot:2656137-Prymnesium_polylepis.1
MPRPRASVESIGDDQRRLMAPLRAWKSESGTEPESCWYCAVVTHAAAPPTSAAAASGNMA